jgi:transcription antitermination protein NusB
VRDRSRAREWALRVLYAWDVRPGGSDLLSVADQILARRHVAPARRPYLRRLVEAIAEDPAAVDAELQHCLTNWRLERLSAIDRNVLRIAAVEMLRFDDIPPRVSIREALWLAEKYGTDRSPSFVNGVLDALMRRTGRS